MSAFGGKADMAVCVARTCPLMTQSGRGIAHFGLHDSITDNRSHGTSAVPEGYLFSHLANESSKEGTRAGGAP
jgi:hypothetical protein